MIFLKLSQWNDSSKQTKPGFYWPYCTYKALVFSHDFHITCAVIVSMYLITICGFFTTDQNGVSHCCRKFNILRKYTRCIKKSCHLNIESYKVKSCLFPLWVGGGWVGKGVERGEHSSIFVHTIHNTVFPETVPTLEGRTKVATIHRLHATLDLST